MRSSISQVTGDARSTGRRRRRKSLEIGRGDRHARELLVESVRLLERICPTTLAEAERALELIASPYGYVRQLMHRARLAGIKYDLTVFEVNGVGFVERASRPVIRQAIAWARIMACELGRASAKEVRWVITKDWLPLEYPWRIASCLEASGYFRCVEGGDKLIFVRPEERRSG